LQQYYEIRPSLSQCIFLLSGHALAAAAIYFYLEPALLMLAILAAVGLLAFSESRCLIQQEIIKLVLDPGDKSIEFKQGKQPYFYSKYKVYQTRWFAILKLVDADKSRTLILNPDCFDSHQAYQQLRYQLHQMEQAMEQAGAA
jgi:hypothetical protein